MERDPDELVALLVVAGDYRFELREGEGFGF